MRILRVLIAGLIVLMCAGSSWAYIYMPGSVSVAKEYADAFIKSQPEVAEGYFFLGAVNGIAWAKGMEGEVDMSSTGGGKNAPCLVPWKSVMLGDRVLPVTEDAMKSLREAVVNYRKAVEMEKGNARYQLGLGWAYEQAGKAKLNPGDAAGLSDDERKRCEAAVGLLERGDGRKQEEGARVLGALLPRSAGVLSEAKKGKAEIAGRVNSILEKYWMELAVERYRAAYEMSVEKELKEALYDIEADNSVAVKAGERLVVVLTERGLAKEGEVERITEVMKKIKGKPMKIMEYG